MEEVEKREEVQEGGRASEGASVLFFVTSGHREDIKTNGREAFCQVFILDYLGICELMYRQEVLYSHKLLCEDAGASKQAHLEPQHEGRVCSPSHTHKHPSQSC